MYDVCANGQILKCLTIVDEYARECLAIDVVASIRSQRVIEVLNNLVTIHGLPQYLRSDNGLPAESTDIYLKNIPGTCTVPDNKSRPSAACT